MLYKAPGVAHADVEIEPSELPVKETEKVGHLAAHGGKVVGDHLDALSHVGVLLDECVELLFSH